MSSRCAMSVSGPSVPLLRFNVVNRAASGPGVVAVRLVNLAVGQVRAVSQVMLWILT
jgi:hypothetical protein